MEKLLEGGRITGTITYKDFFRPDLNWRVEKDKNGILHCFGTQLACAKIARNYLDEQETRIASVKCASKIIKAVENEMLDRKPNELKNIIDYYTELYTTKDFGNNNLSPYDYLALKKQYVKLHSKTQVLMGEHALVTKVNQAAFAKAIVYKYFEENLKVAKDRRTGLARTMNNLSASEKEEAKNWLKDHVKSLVFKVPLITTNADGEDNIVAYNINKEFDNDKADEIRDHINKLTDTFEKLYPNAKEGRDFVYRETAKENDVRKDLWNLGAITTFDTRVAELPAIIQTMLETARRQSTQETKSMDEIADEYSVSSIPLAQAILDLFNNDFNFYKKQKDDSLINNGLDALINDYID